MTAVLTDPTPGDTVEGPAGAGSGRPSGAVRLRPAVLQRAASSFTAVPHVTTYTGVGVADKDCMGWTVTTGSAVAGAHCDTAANGTKMTPSNQANVLCGVRRDPKRRSAVRNDAITVTTATACETR